MAGLGQDGDETLPQLEVVVHEKDSFQPSRLPGTLLAVAQRDFAFQAEYSAGVNLAHLSPASQEDLFNLSGNNSRERIPEPQSDRNHIVTISYAMAARSAPTVPRNKSVTSSPNVAPSCGNRLSPKRKPKAIPPIRHTVYGNGVRMLKALLPRWSAGSVAILNSGLRICLAQGSP